MATEKEKSRKLWELFLAVFGAVTGAYLGYIFSNTGVANKPESNGVVSNFFSVSSNLITPLFTLCCVVAGLSAVYLILKIFDILDVIFHDFWDLFH